MSQKSRCKHSAPSASSGVSARNVEHRIKSGQLILARMRVKVASALFVLGLVCAASYWVLVFMLPEDTSHCAREWEDYVRFLTLSCLMHARILLWGLAPFYDDKRMMRATMAIEMVVVVTEAYSDIFLNYSPYPMAQGVSWAICNCVVIGGFARAMAFQDARPMRNLMWHTLHVWIWLGLLLNAFWVTLASLQCGHRTGTPFVAWMVPKLLLATSLARPVIRQKLHSRMLAFFEGRSQAQAAAAVAGWVGHCPADEVVRLAAARFRAVELAAVTREDMASNAPDPSLFARSFPACLNECDAFISHSWHDDPTAKWASLQQWRTKFLAEHGREPRVWIDKFCIDQNNIETDLRCLPAFVGGCRKLVVFCGTTYMCRLWCIVEVFTFVHMGRKLDSLEFELVLRTGHENDDMSSVEKALDEFDCETCKCFAQQDKDRMMDIIYAVFGSIPTFNKVVRDTFRRTRMKAACTLKRSTSDREACFARTRQEHLLGKCTLLRSSSEQWPREADKNQVIRTKTGEGIVIESMHTASGKGIV